MASEQVIESFHHLPKTAEEARFLNLPHYFTGIPCVRGHISWRFASRNECSACRRLNVARRMREVFWSEDGGANLRAKTKSKNSARRAAKSCLSPEDRAACNEFYKNCPPGFHVDHIIPLGRRSGPGSHTISNLQYLSAAENLSKGNKVDPLTLEANVCVLPEFRTYKHT